MQVFKEAHFDGQEENEMILRVVHRHWFDITVQFIPALVGVFFMIVSAGVVPVLFPEFWEQSAPSFWFFETLIAMVLWVWSALIFVDYVLDVWIITDRRVVNVEQKGLFVRQVSELRYQKIQDVTTEVEGFFPTLLNYGEVFVQTAGEKARFLFHNIPRPYEVKSVIMDLQKRTRKHDLGEMENILRGEDGTV